MDHTGDTLISSLHLHMYYMVHTASKAGCGLCPRHTSLSTCNHHIDHARIGARMDVQVGACLLAGEGLIGVLADAAVPGPDGRLLGVEEVDSTPSPICNTSASVLLLEDRSMQVYHCCRGMKPVHACRPQRNRSNVLRQVCDKMQEHTGELSLPQTNKMRGKYCGIPDKRWRTQTRCGRVCS